MEWTITADSPGKTYLMQGNEAFARGAIEGGIGFAASYPGSPSSEILDMLGRAADKIGYYAEWSVNEKSAFEACLGASFAGTRAICAMKQNGLLLIADALYSAALSGCRGGLVIISSDDPGANTSSNEFDSRNQAKAANIPLLEPATFQEAKDMVKWGFELSETLKQVVLVRGVTRIHHGRGNVTVGEIPPRKPVSMISETDRFIGWNDKHPLLLEKMDKAREIFEASPFNHYVGPAEPELLIVTSGVGWFYSQEAVHRLNLQSRVGILKLGTTWPLPEKLAISCLTRTQKVLIVEEVDPFLEQNLIYLVSQTPELRVKFYGRGGKKPLIPPVGELNPDLVIKALSELMAVSYETRKQSDIPAETEIAIPPRDLTFCAGCPHRATYFILKQALEIDERKGFVVGDIGCYTLGLFSAGYNMIRCMGCMGSGINIAEGLGQLNRFGFAQPVVALAGDSTFFHTCIPGLISAKMHDAEMLFIILDNSATAMTGFQPHPGTGVTAMGKKVEPFSIERIVESIGCQVTIADPYQVKETIETVYRLLKQPGLKVLILRRECATLASRKLGKKKAVVNPDLCRGDECGCGRYCSKVWGCPGNIWDEQLGKAKIDETVCIGCGVCAELCPTGAIQVVKGGEK